MDTYYNRQNKPIWESMAPAPAAPAPVRPRIVKQSLVRRWLRKPLTPLVILVVFAGLAVSAGAAVGTVLGGTIDGAIPITVGQALVVDKPAPGDGFPVDRRFFSSTSDDKTNFSIALEMFREESLTVLVPIVNRSSGDLVSELTMTVPDIPSLIEDVPGLTLSVDGSGIIADVVQISPDSWTFTSPAAADGLDGTSPEGPDGLLITYTTAPTALAGFFDITGRVRVLEY